MGFFSDIGKRVETFWKKDKDTQATKLARGNTFKKSGYGGPAGFGYGADVCSDLAVETDLLARYADYEEMDEYPEIACLSGDSRVGILGKGEHGIEYVTISELLFRRKLYPEVAMYTLAVDVAAKCLVPVKFKGPILSGKNQPVFKVTFEQYRGNPGKPKKQWSLRVTATHPFMLRDGSYRTAGDLKPRDCLMPVTARTASNGYPQVGDPFETRQGQTIWTNFHSLVARGLERALEAHEVVHHEDEDKQNLHPSNLKIESRALHTQIHAITKRPEVREQLSNFSKKRWADSIKAAKWASSQRRSQDVSPSCLTSKNLTPQGILSDAHRKAIAEGRTIPLARDIVENALRTSPSMSEAARKLKVSWNTLGRRMGQFGFPSGIIGTSLQTVTQDQAGYDNHVVVSVEPDGFDDVYDIEVPIYKNFLAEGVFVHNTAIDIFADDSTQLDSQLNRTVWVTAKDESLQRILTDMLHKRLRIDEEIWEISRSLCKFGNDFEELLVTNEGVVGLNFLPAPTTRRIEDCFGALKGFIQTRDGKIGFSTEEFDELLCQRNDEINSCDSNDYAPQVIALEDWEVVHFRLRSKHRRSVYGYCLAGSSRVWTTKGIKEIQNVRAGDRVLTRHAGRLLSTLVLDQVCSGTKPIYSLRTTHRDIWLTADHPVLVDRGGKNNAWVPAGELKTGEKIVIATKMPELCNPPALGLHLVELTDHAPVRFTTRGIRALRSAQRIQKYGSRAEGLEPMVGELGISRGQLTELFAGHSSVPLALARQLFTLCEVPFFDGAVQRVKEDERLTLPDFVEPWFARLWGFLLGDGWLTDGQVYFALGIDHDRNRYYESLLEKTGLPVSRGKDDAGVDRQAYVSSTALVGLMRCLGWVDGAHDKRVPSWIYNLAREFRKELLAGFTDADGWDTYDGRYQHTEICNIDLLRDLKNLIDGLGWTSGKIRTRDPRTSQLKSGKEIHAGEQYMLTYHEKPLGDGGEFVSEEVVGFDLIGEEPVYDIQVANAGHCFIADGVVVHNSVLEPARWIWKRLMMMEDAAILFRLQKAMERYAFYVDVGDMPPAEALAYVNRVRQQYRKKRFVNPNSGKLELQFNPGSPDDDFWVPTRQGRDATRIDVVGSPQWQCLVGDTRVPLLDGSSPTIEELSKRTDEFWLYSIDSKGRVVPGKGRAARQTHEAAEILEVELDNGEKVRCTSNHPFLTRDGKWTLAEHLLPGDSLMPLYRKESSHASGDKEGGYEKVYDPVTNEWIYTHHRVFEETTEADLAGFFRHGNVIHHADYKKRNNAPENLAGMTRPAHMALHMEHTENLRWSPQKHVKHRAMMIERMSDKVLRADKAKILADWNRSPERRESVLGESHPRWNTLDVAGLEYLVLATGARGIHELMEKGRIGQSTIGRILKAEGLTWNLFAQKNIPGWEAKGRALHVANHKVVSVRKTGEVAPVFDLTVEKHANFAIGSGVFVSNSMDDIEYFRDKLFAGLKVPKSYLAQEQEVARATLSSQDVRFARSVLRVQRELKTGIGKICRVHLAAVGIDPAKAEFEIHMTVPSAIFELAQLEVRSARADLAARLADFVSLRWTLENILGLSDKEIVVVMKEKQGDTVRGLEAQGQGEAAAAALMNEVPVPEEPAQEGVSVGPETVGELGQRVRQRSSKMGLNSGPISEKELSVRYDKAEKRAESKIDQLLRSDAVFAKRLREVRSLLEDIRTVQGSGQRSPIEKS